jgi:hypothetical protein
MNIPDIKISADLTKLTAQAYEDGISPALREVSGIGVDILKTIRLALAPIQYSAMLQDKLSMRLKKALESVPETDRGNPIPQLSLQIADKLKYSLEDDVLSEMYVRLLSLSFDKRQFGNAHPAFLNVISQLCADEASLVQELSNKPPLMYFGKSPLSWASSKQDIRAKVSSVGIKIPEHLWGSVLGPEVLSQPEYLQTFIEHLQSLGIITYQNLHSDLYQSLCTMVDGQCWYITLTRFGTMFHEACMDESIRASADDRL